MTRIDLLRKNYQRLCEYSWDRNVAGSQRVWLAVYDGASLFGFLKVSEILPLVEGDVRGRLLVFFPGTYEQNNYRLLDARDGWNYHAVPITAGDGKARP